MTILYSIVMATGSCRPATGSDDGPVITPLTALEDLRPTAPDSSYAPSENLPPRHGSVVSLSYRLVSRAPADKVNARDTEEPNRGLESDEPGPLLQGIPVAAPGKAVGFTSRGLGSDEVGPCEQGDRVRIPTMAIGLSLALVKRAAPGPLQPADPAGAPGMACGFTLFRLGFPRAGEPLGGLVMAHLLWLPEATVSLLGSRVNPTGVIATPALGAGVESSVVPSIPMEGKATQSIGIKLETSVPPTERGETNSSSWRNRGDLH